MATSNPLSDLTKLGTNALTSFTPLVTAVPIGKMQLFDRVVDVRGEIADNPEMRDRLWFLPARSTVEMYWSSTSARFIRRYQVGFGNGLIKLEGKEYLEWLIIQAFTWLVEGFVYVDSLGEYPPPDPRPIVIPPPWTEAHWGLGDSDPTREPIADPEEWTDVCDLICEAFVDREAIKNWIGT